MHCIGRKCIIESRVVIAFHIMAFITMLYIPSYGLIAANFGSWSHWGEKGYVLFLIYAGLFLATVIWVGYFFHTHGRRHYEQRRIIGKSIFLVFVYLVGIYSAYCLLHHPTKREMREYLRTFLRYKDESIGLPKIMHLLQTERKCCGIESYLDYQHPKLKKSKTMYIPDSCCRVIKPDCADPLNISSPNFTSIIYTKGCIKNDISEIQNTQAYLWTKVIRIFTMIPVLFPVFTIIVMQIIICLTRPKNELPHRPRNYNRKQSWEEAPKDFIQMVFHTDNVIPTDLELSEGGDDYDSDQGSISEEDLSLLERISR